MLASFPGPTKLSVTINMEKWGEPGIFSHVSKRYQALPTFPYCKRQKAGWGLGTRVSTCHIQIV